MFSRVSTQERQFSRRTIETGTGKGWDEWANLMDGNGYRNKDLSVLIKYLTTQHKLSQGWARTIASYYVLDQIDSSVIGIPSGR